MKDKNMCKIIPYDACPRCGNREFLIYEKEENVFYTKQGNLQAIDNISYKCQGTCIKCKTIYDILNTPTMFIPMTPLRKVLFNYPKEENEKLKQLKNPMEK